MKMLVAWNGQKASIFMVKETTVAETRPAGMTIEFVAVANLVPALSAFYASIDQLKHREFRSSEPRPKFMLLRHMPLNTVSPSRAIQKTRVAHFLPVGQTQRETIAPHRGFKLHRIGLSQCRGGKSADCRDRDSD